MSIPLPVLQFALLDSKDGGLTPANPIAWRETAEEWIIIYEDGRKIRHSKTEPRPAAIDGLLADAGRKKESRTAKKQARQD